MERVRDMATDPKEKQDLSVLMSVVGAAAVPADLFAALPGTIRLVKRRDVDVFVIRQGQLRAVVTVDPAVPDRMIVTSLYRADDDEDSYHRDVVPDTTAAVRPGQT